MSESPLFATTKTGRRLPVARDFALYVGLFTIICIVLQTLVGAYASDHGQTSDEAGYFVSSLMIDAYVKGHLFSAPMTFAKEYYSHFPRVSIGHYPPFFTGVQAALFVIFGGTGLVAGAFQAVVGGLCAALSAILVRRHMGGIEGLLAGIAVLCSPFLLFLISTDMADVLLAVLVMLTAVSWSWFYFERKWIAGILFSIAASASILTKGTAIGLAIFPIIYLTYKRDFWFLFDVKTLTCAFFVAVLTVPWYIATYKMTAGGFNYSWGLGYTAIAVLFFCSRARSKCGIPHFRSLCGFLRVGYFRQELLWRTRCTFVFGGIFMYDRFPVRHSCGSFAAISCSRRAVHGGGSLLGFQKNG